MSIQEFQSYIVGKRSYLTAQEGAALATHFPEVLDSGNPDREDGIILGGSWMYNICSAVAIWQMGNELHFAHTGYSTKLPFHTSIDGDITRDDGMRYGIPSILGRVEVWPL